MYSRFPLSLERLPKVRCGCVSLRTAAAATALIAIMYSVLGMSQWLAEVTLRTPRGEGAAEQWAWLAAGGGVLLASFLTSAAMLIGVLRDSVCLIRPWLVLQSVQLAAGVVLLLAAGATLAAPGAGENSLAALAVHFLILLVRFYMVLVVASYCSELQQRDDETQRLQRLHRGSWYTTV